MAGKSHSHRTQLHLDTTPYTALELFEIMNFQFEVRGPFFAKTGSIFGPFSVNISKILISILVFLLKFPMEFTF